MGTDVGDARQLQQALDGAVLAVFTMEHREHHVNTLPHHAVALKAQQALVPDRGQGHLADLGIMLPLPRRDLGKILADIQQPIALLGNAHRENIIFLGVHIVQHRFGAAQRDLVLRASAAEQDTHTQLLHILFLISHCLPAGLLPPGKYRRHP